METHRCVCGATIRFRQDMHLERGADGRTWKCKDCLTPLPGVVAERIGHQHPR